MLAVSIAPSFSWVAKRPHALDKKVLDEAEILLSQLHLVACSCRNVVEVSLATEDTGRESVEDDLNFHDGVLRMSNVEVKVKR
jgi:hypothetical protein